MGPTVYRCQRLRREVTKRDELQQLKSEAYDRAIQLAKDQQLYNEIVVRINKLEEQED
jgi:hypothetical protein